MQTENNIRKPRAPLSPAAQKIRDDARALSKIVSLAETLDAETREQAVAAITKLNQPPA